MHYVVAVGVAKKLEDAIEGLKEEVKKLCESGYKPNGGVSISEEPGKFMAVQIMEK